MSFDTIWGLSVIVGMTLWVSSAVRMVYLIGRGKNPTEDKPAYAIAFIGFLLIFLPFTPILAIFGVAYLIGKWQNNK